MKTLLLAPELFRAEGGIARILRSYLQALCEEAGEGEEVHFLALNDGAVEPEKIRPHSKGRPGAHVGCERSKLGFIFFTFRLGWGSDRVICGHLHQLAVVWLLSIFRPRINYYLVAHGIEVWRPYGWLERRALRKAHRILCVSEYTRRQMLRFDPKLDRTRLVIVPNTFDPGFIAPTGKSLTLLPGSGPRILVVSRLTRADAYKGFDTLIEAMPQVLRQYPAAQLRIVGGGDDERRLRDLVSTLHLEDTVHFAGIVNDAALGREYAACDIFALPSRKEGFGLVYLEAMAHGKPCLAARAGGAPEVVNSEVGALVEYGNTDQIAVAVADLVRHPRDPVAIFRRAEQFAFPAFKQHLTAALRD